MMRTRRRAIVVALVSVVLGSMAACVSVGHPAQVGCLVDMSEPGCSDASVTVSDSASDSAADDLSSGDAGEVGCQADGRGCPGSPEASDGPEDSDASEASDAASADGPSSDAAVGDSALVFDGD